MTRPAALAVAVLVAAALAPPADASFGAPVQLTAGSNGIGVVADTDAAGLTTALVSTYMRGPRLFERPSGGAWSAPTALPGDPKGMAGPVVDAAGNGALGIAWRVDAPRRYGAIAVAMRDPGGALSEPTEIAGDDAGGVRHPALAIDPQGDALLAYNTATRKVHLSLRGAIAITSRRAGSFAPPAIVDSTPSSAPAVAMASDGTGVVAWTHDRRVYVVSVSAAGEIGKVKRFASPDGVVGLVAAAGEGGAATLAWVGHRPGAGTVRSPRSRYLVRAMSRTAGHAFAAIRTVAATSDYVRGIAIAADEDGRVTLAWSREHFGDDHSVGNNGITSAVLATTAQAGRPLPAPQVVAKRGSRYLTQPTVAAANGRVALAWASAASRRDAGVQAAVGRPGAIGSPQTVVAKTLNQATFAPEPVIQVALAPDGAATVFYVEPTEMAPPAPAFVLKAADGP
jgi:hypothetical protein